MKISERVESSLKEATLKKDEALKMTLRNIKAKFIVAIKDNKNQPLTDESEVKVLEKMIKDSQKSIEMCAGNSESGNSIALREEKEIEIIKTFLPEKPTQLSAEDIEAAVALIIKGGGYTSLKEHMGKVMSEFNSRYPGQDKKVASEKIRSFLS